MQNGEYYHLAECSRHDIVDQLLIRKSLVHSFKLNYNTKQSQSPFVTFTVDLLHFVIRNL